MREIKFEWFSEIEQRMLSWEEVKRLCSWEHLSSKGIRQFTGLLDKNGREIYEGDIIDVSGSINTFKERGEVLFDYGCYFFDGKRFAPKHLTTYPRDLLCECQTTFYTKNTPPEIPLTKFVEIIGNIYENPELLNPPNKE